MEVNEELRKYSKVSILALAAVIMFSVCVYAAGPNQGDSINAVVKPSISVLGNTATCSARVTAVR